MNVPAESTDPDAIVAARADQRRRAERHRLAETIAAGLLPERAGDQQRESGYSASWYAENRPPHHDR